MGAYLTKQKVLELVENRPEGMEEKDVLRNLVSKGYELEGLNSKFTPMEMVKNVPKSTLEFGKSIWTALKDPLKSAEAISDLAYGAIQKITPEPLKGVVEFGQKVASAPMGVMPRKIDKEKSQQTFEGMLDFYIDRYGNKDRLLNTIEKDPTGFLSDVSLVLQAGGAGLKAVSGAGKASKFAKFAGGIQRTGRFLEPTELAIKTARAFNETTGINKLIRKVATGSAQRFMKTGITMSSSQEAKLAGKARVSGTPVKFLTEHGIYGSLDDIYKQLDYIGKKTKSIVDDNLAKIPNEYKLASAKRILNQVDDMFSKEKGLSKEFLQSQRRTSKLLKKINDKGLNLTELNEVKRLSDEYLNIFKQSGEAKESFKFQNMSKLRQNLRQTIELKAEAAGIKNISKLNQQTQLAQGLKQVIDQSRKSTRLASTLAERLVERITIGGGVTGAIVGQPSILAGAAAVYGTNKIMQIPKVRTWLAVKLQLMGNNKLKVLEAGITTGKQTSAFRQAVQEIRRDFRKAFPELRIVGKTQEQANATQ